MEVVGWELVARHLNAHMHDRVNSNRVVLCRTNKLPSYDNAQQIEWPVPEDNGWVVENLYDEQRFESVNRIIASLICPIDQPLHKF